MTGLKTLVNELAGYGPFRAATIAGVRLSLDRIEQNVAPKQLMSVAVAKSSERFVTSGAFPFSEGFECAGMKSQKDFLAPDVIASGAIVPIRIIEDISAINKLRIGIGASFRSLLQFIDLGFRIGQFDTQISGIQF